MWRGGKGGTRREGRGGGLSGNVAEEAFCLKSAPRYSGPPLLTLPKGFRMSESYPAIANSQEVLKIQSVGFVVALWLRNPITF